MIRSGIQMMKPNSVPPTPVIDREELVERMMGSAAMAERMLSRFLDTAGADCDLLESAVRLGDQAMTASVAHRHKGAAKTMAAPRVAQLAAELEQRAQTDSVSTLLELVNQMRTLHQEVREVFQRDFALHPGEGAP